MLSGSSRTSSSSATSSVNLVEVESSSKGTSGGRSKSSRSKSSRSSKTSKTSSKQIAAFSMSSKTTEHSIGEGESLRSYLSRRSSHGSQGVVMSGTSSPSPEPLPPWEPPALPVRSVASSILSVESDSLQLASVADTPSVTPSVEPTADPVDPTRSKSGESIQLGTNTEQSVVPAHSTPTTTTTTTTRESLSLQESESLQLVCIASDTKGQTDTDIDTGSDTDAPSVSLSTTMPAVGVPVVAPAPVQEADDEGQDAVLTTGSSHSGRWPVVSHDLVTEVKAQGEGADSADDTCDEDDEENEEELRSIQQCKRTMKHINTTHKSDLAMLTKMLAKEQRTHYTSLGKAQTHAVKLKKQREDERLQYLEASLELEREERHQRRLENKDRFMQAMKNNEKRKSSRGRSGTPGMPIMAMDVTSVKVPKMTETEEKVWKNLEAHREQQKKARRREFRRGRGRSAPAKRAEMDLIGKRSKTTVKHCKRLYEEGLEMNLLKDEWSAAQRVISRRREMEANTQVPAISDYAKSMSKRSRALSKERQYRKQPPMPTEDKEILQCTFTPRINEGKGGASSEAFERLHTDAASKQIRSAQALQLRATTAQRFVSKVVNVNSEDTTAWLDRLSYSYVGQREMLEAVRGEIRDEIRKQATTTCHPPSTANVLNTASTHAAEKERIRQNTLQQVAAKPIPVVSDNSKVMAAERRRREIDEYLTGMETHCGSKKVMLSRLKADGYGRMLIDALLTKRVICADSEEVSLDDVVEVGAGMHGPFHPKKILSRELYAPPQPADVKAPHNLHQKLFEDASERSKRKQFAVSAFNQATDPECTFRPTILKHRSRSGQTGRGSFKSQKPQAYQKTLHEHKTDVLDRLQVILDRDHH